eukprot:scaffold15090_cov50-Cyclotella_meneghiniana.AAC.3
MRSISVPLWFGLQYSCPISVSENVDYLRILIVSFNTPVVVTATALPHSSYTELWHFAFPAPPIHSNGVFDLLLMIHSRQSYPGDTT